MPGASEKRLAHDDLSHIDLAKLLVARLWVARLGEGDVLGWWRTSSLLGSEGAFVGPRVLPITHATARARIVFAVAAHACTERYPDPKASHLFRLDARTEDRLDGLLVRRLEDHAFWHETMKELEAVTPQTEPKDTLLKAGVITAEDARYAAHVKAGPDRRSLPIAVARSADETIRRLTAGFLRSSKGEFAVPYLVGREQVWR
jgi:hypothetical protein